MRNQVTGSGGGSYRVVMERTVIDRLSAVSSTSLADAAPALVVLPTSLRPVVPGRKFAGRAVTVRAERDLMGVIAGLAAAEAGDGHGRHRNEVGRRLVREAVTRHQLHAIGRGP